MEFGPIIIGLFTVILGGGGLAALLKFKPETTNITVTSAEKVIILQSDELKRLYARLNDLEERVNKYENQETTLQNKISDLEARLDNAEADLIAVTRERDQLKKRVKVLENNSK